MKFLNATMFWRFRRYAGFTMPDYIFIEFVTLIYVKRLIFNIAEHEEHASSRLHDPD